MEIKQRMKKRVKRFFFRNEEGHQKKFCTLIFCLFWGKLGNIRDICWFLERFRMMKQDTTIKCINWCVNCSCKNPKDNEMNEI